VPYLSASVVVIYYEEALYQVYASLPLPHEIEVAECDWHWVFPTVKTRWLPEC